jgi:hypothetical protein
MSTEGTTPFTSAPSRDAESLIAAAVEQSAGSRVRWRDGRAWIALRSEFAMVEVALAEGRNGPALLVRDSESGATVSLDPLELEALTRLRHEDLARHLVR